LRKIIFTIVQILSIALIGALVNTANVASEELSIYSLKGPSGVGMIYMFETPPVIPGFEVKMKVLPASDFMAASLIRGEAKVGILPPNVAAKIASSGVDIKIAAVTGNGMLSLLSGDPSITNIEALRGKTVSVAGQGAVPEYVFKKILLSRGSTLEKNVRFDFSLAYPEIAASLISGRIKTALLPEPFASMALAGAQENIKLHSVADIQDEWQRIVPGNNNFPMTVLVVSGDFARKNPGAMKIILDSYKASIDFVAANPKEAGLLVEKHDFGLRANVITAAIPKSNYVFLDSLKARPALDALFQVLFELEPASIGGKMPGGDLYYWR
jgi:NitT/TauT family transport system substrate-binding protein